MAVSDSKVCALAPSPKYSKRLSTLATQSLGNLRNMAAEPLDPCFPTSRFKKNAWRLLRILPGPGLRADLTSVPNASKPQSPYRFISPASPVHLLGPDFSSNCNSAFEPPMASVREARPFPHNPRKSRRHATDFGLGRDTQARIHLAPPLVPMSSFPAVSAGYLPSTPSLTPLTVSDTCTGSENSSLSQGLASFVAEFPEPPSLSPTLRRMRSVPWLVNVSGAKPPNSFASADSILAQAHGNIQILDHGIEEPENVAIQSLDSLESTLSVRDHSYWGSKLLSLSDNPVGLQSKQLDLEMVGEALIGVDINSLKSEYRTTAIPAQNNLASHEVVPVWTELDGFNGTYELLQWSTSHRASSPRGYTLANASPLPPPTSGEANSNIKHSIGRRYTVNINSDNSSGKMPQVIRKVASLRPETRNSQFSDTLAPRPIPKIKSLRFFPSSMNSTKDEALAGRVPKNGNKEARQRSWLISKSSPHAGKAPLSIEKGFETRYNLPNRTPYPSSGQTRKLIERRISSGLHRRQLQESASLTGLGFSNFGTSTELNISDPSAHPRALGEPFFLRETYPPVNPSLVADETHILVSNSFIDITPEQMQSTKHMIGDKKDRVKRFFARASTGFLLWGKHAKVKYHSP